MLSGKLPSSGGAYACVSSSCSGGFSGIGPNAAIDAVITAVILVAAAGITHPRIRWIHWVNAFIAVWGTILFGTSAVTHYRAGGGVLDTTFIYTEALALLFLGAVYFVTRTIRGFLQQDQQQG